MAITLHSASAPALRRALNNMLGWLDKAQAHAQARKFDTANYLGLRLAPDMLPFVKQIQIASDNAKGCMARLAGIEIPKFEDDETTFDQLRERIRKTVAFVDSVTADQLADAESREIVLKLRSGELRFTAQDYLRHYALPNFYFHVTTAYALLRHAGVELGKPDFLGR